MMRVALPIAGCVVMLGCGGQDGGSGSGWGVASSASSGNGGAAQGGAMEGAASTTAASGGVGGASGTGGSASAGGMGGAGGVGVGGAGGIPLPECALPSECPPHTNKCLEATCEAGACGFSPLPSGTPYPTQTAGDCKTLLCDGMGGTVSENVLNDPADDGNECTTDQCNAGATQHILKASGAGCAQNGGTKCDAAGACVECFVHSECATTHSCVAGSCAPLHGCSFATTSLSSSDVTVHFGGTYGNNFVPKCIKIRAGTGVNFINHGTLGHPLTSGMVVAGILIPDPTGPYYPTVLVPSLYGKQLFDIGTFPFYSDLYGLQGMAGVVYVIPP